MAIGRQQFHCTQCGLDFSGRMSNTGKIYAYDRAPDAGHPPRQDAICMDCLAKAEEAAEPEETPVDTPKPPEGKTRVELLAGIAELIAALTTQGIVLDAHRGFLMLIIGCGTLRAYEKTEPELDELVRSARAAADDLWDYLMEAAKRSPTQ